MVRGRPTRAKDSVKSAGGSRPCRMRSLSGAMSCSRRHRRFDLAAQPPCLCHCKIRTVGRQIKNPHWRSVGVFRATYSGALFSEHRHTQVPDFLIDFSKGPSSENLVSGVNFVLNRASFFSGLALFALFLKALGDGDRRYRKPTAGISRYRRGAPNQPPGS